MTSPGRRRRGRLPHRRRGRPGGHRLPRRLPPRGDRAGRRLRRDDAHRRGLGAELPDPGGRRPDLVHPRAARSPTGRGPACGALAKQYFRYGRWRRVVARRTRRRSTSATWPPPVATAVNRPCCLARRARRDWRPGRCRRRPLSRASASSIPLTYLAGDHRGRRPCSPGDLPAGVRVRVPLVLAAMHMCWGAGFLTSPRRLRRRHQLRGRQIARRGARARLRPTSTDIRAADRIGYGF